MRHTWNFTLFSVSLWKSKVILCSLCIKRVLSNGLRLTTRGHQTWARDFNIVVHSVHWKSICNQDQEPSCSSTGIPTDDERPYVLVAFMICITLKDVCIHFLLLMKKAISTYWIWYLCQVWALSLIWAPQPKQKNLTNRSHHWSVHWQCVQRQMCLHFHTPVNNRVAIFWYMVFY
jgi:hypothetical protein